MRTIAIETLFGAAGAGDSTAKSAKPRSSFWTRFSAAIVAARTIQARAIVARQLAHEPDATFKSLGWTDAEITDLRRRHR